MKYSTKTLLVLLLFVSAFGFSMIPVVNAAWLAGWEHRQAITVFGASGAGINYQVMLNVAHDPAMQTDFDDLRFTDDDGSTLLDHWLESKTDSSYALCWVEVADNLNTTQIIYMYYGNDAVSSASNGPATFPFFDDFNDGSINTTLWYHWFSGGTSTEAGGILSVAGAGSSEAQGAKFKFGTSYAYEFSTYFALDNQNYEQVGFDDRSDDGIFEGSGIDRLIVQFDASKKYSEQSEGTSNNEVRTTDYTDPIRLSLRRSTTSVLVYENGSLIDTLNTQVPLDDCGIMIYANTAGSITYLDYTFVRKYIAGVSALFGVWTEAGLVIPIFRVPFDMWGMDTALIILGLVMVPTSTIYLAYGIKHDRSSNRLFYGLIIFFLGCGLFIGGVLP